MFEVARSQRRVSADEACNLSVQAREGRNSTDKYG